MRMSPLGFTWRKESFLIFAIPAFPFNQFDPPLDNVFLLIFPTKRDRTFSRSNNRIRYYFTMWSSCINFQYGATVENLFLFFFKLPLGKFPAYISKCNVFRKIRDGRKERGRIWGVGLDGAGSIKKDAGVIYESLLKRNMLFITL